MYTIKNTSIACKPSIGATGAAPAGSAGQVVYLVSSGIAGAASNFYWDSTDDSVGIGISAPTANLHVIGNIYVSNNLTTTNVYASNRIGVGTTSPAYALDVTGTIRATQDIIAFSDSRVKTELRKIENALEKVSKISGYTFSRTDYETRRQAGVLAQEVMEVLPEVVYQDENGRYNVAYGNMIALLIEAIKEEKVKREALEKLLEQR